MLSRILRGLTVFIILLVVTVVVVGFVLPAQWTVRAEQNYNSSIDRIWPSIAELKQWPEWTAWNREAQPNMSWSFSGPERGPGATQTWQDPSSSGVLVVNSEQPNESMHYSVTMEEANTSMNCSIKAEASASGSKLIWQCGGDSGNNPLARVMMKVFTPFIRKQFQIGLDRLKTQVDAS